MSLSASDAQELVEFLKFMEKHKDLVEGYNTKVPIEGYIMIGSLTILVFDYFITLDQEVNFVWSSPWSLGLPLFYINRYVPFIDLSLFIHLQFSYLSTERCRREVPVATWLVTVPSFVGQLIIVLRTCALWQNKAPVVWFLMLTQIAALAVTSHFTAGALKNATFAPTPSFMRGCIGFQDSRATLYIYIVLFIGELIIITLTVIKAAQHLRQNRTAWVSQLYKNGIFYCICILLLSLINILVPLTKLPYIYKQVLRLPQHVFQSMFCNRVIFQLFEYRHYTMHRAYNPSSSLDPSTDIGTSNVLTSVFIDTTTSKTDDIELSTIHDYSKSSYRVDRDWVT